MVPKRIQQNFVATIDQNDDLTIVEGQLECCSFHQFEVSVVGNIRYGIFSKMYLIPNNENELVIYARCKNCGKLITLFNSKCDGYDQCEGPQTESVAQANNFSCKKCQENNYSVSIKYEYPSEQELRELGFTNIDNAFTWIYVTLKCNKCAAKYKKIVDFETA